MAGRKRQPLEPEPIPVAENDHMVELSLKAFTAPDIDLHDPEQVRERISYYFQECSRLELRPSNLGLYSFLGMTKQDVSDVLRGANRSKVSPEAIDLLKKAKLALSCYREQLAMNGRLNPVTAIFWGKNFDNMADTQVLEVSREQTYQARMTPEQIAREIELSIPIDTDTAAILPEPGQN